MRELAFIDVETTGLNPERHEIIEIAALAVHPSSMQVIAHAHTKVKPERLGDADPEALGVAGYDDERWSDAVPLAAALRAVAPVLRGRAVAGHNIEFDWSFLVAAWRRCGLEAPPVDHRRLDTMSLAWPLLARGHVRSLSLDALCRHFDIWRPAPHCAAADVRATVRLYMEICALHGPPAHSSWR